MQYKAILFDLDGTLLPMDNDVFVKGYFKELAKKCCPFGIDPETLTNSVWAGTKAMMKNTGERPNIDVFWDTFSAVSGKEYTPFKNASDAFYTQEFNAAKQYTFENPLAPEAIRLARTCAEVVVCASNPVFPLNGHLTRLSWIGLKGEDFDLITSYESDSYCKPNPAYFQTICDRIGVAPETCLMVGNNEEEDMYAASAAGMDCYLITDHAIPSETHPWNGKQGTFAELITFLQECNR